MSLRVLPWLRTTACLIPLLLAPGRILAQGDQLSNVKMLVDQARASFDQLDYENTVKALDSAIGAIEARPTPEAKRLLASAYEMRARSLFGFPRPFPVHCAFACRCPLMGATA